MLCAVVLLGLGFSGGVCCFRSSTALRLMLIQGMPVTCPYRDTQFKLPGRPVALLMMGVPALSSVGGALLLMRAFWKEDQDNA